VRDLKPLFERHGVQLYLNGHDHDMQVIEVNGVHYVTSGAGSRTRPARGGPDSRFSLGNTAGFLDADLTRHELRARFVTWNGDTAYAFALTRTPAHPARP
jgi:acid phosphatase